MLDETISSRYKKMKRNWNTAVDFYSSKSERISCSSAFRWNKYFRHFFLYFLFFIFFLY